MINRKVITLKKPGEFVEDPLTELLRTGARQLITKAVEAELQDLLRQYADLRDEQGHLQVVRNGYRESEKSWMELLLRIKAQGLVEAPELAVGDGALDFWKALCKTFPKRVTNAAGCIKQPTRSIRASQDRSIQGSSRHCTRSGWHRPGMRHTKPLM